MGNVTSRVTIPLWLLDISSSVRDLCLFREKNFSSDKIGSLLSFTKVENIPACVVVVATYKTAGCD